MYRCGQIEITGLVLHGGVGAVKSTVGDVRLPRSELVIVACPAC